MGFIITQKDSLKNLLHFIGWRTKRKIVVLESDDWGSIRMPSITAYNNLWNGGVELSSDEGFRYNKYDSLESAEDLALLFEVLASVKDSTSRTAVLSPYSVVANPDFKKIKQTDFNEYFYEPFTITLNRYYGDDKAFSLWKAGVRDRLFVPQFHGREHLNVRVWMKALRKENKKTRLAFENELWGISSANESEVGVEYQAAFDLLEKEDLEFHKEIIVSGLSLFKELFGYRATCFVPPNGLLSSKLESTCFSEGIKYLSVSRKRAEPLGKGVTRDRYHCLGQKNRSGLTYITRNCFFEPSQSRKDWIDSCLKDISVAFKWQKPAIISSHRVNYSGRFYPINRENGLKGLRILLNRILNTWPDTEFLTTAELGELISNE